MSDITLESMSEQYFDVLKELGNIGAGNATTALSTMLGMKVDMKVPQVRLMEFKEVGTKLNCNIIMSLNSADLSAHIVAHTKESFTQCCVSAYRNSLIWIIKVIIIIYKSERKTLNNKSRKLITVSSPLFLCVSLYKLFKNIFPARESPCSSRLSASKFWIS